jgi:hypothetical protein
MHHYQLPLDAPDGRKILIDVRQGEQHDLPGVMADVAEAFRVGNDYPLVAAQLAKACDARLPLKLVEMPVKIQGKRPLHIRIAAQDDVEAEVKSVCALYGLQGSEGQLTHTLLANLEPGAFVIPFGQ